MTEDWTSGYVADVGYTYGYYPELSPLAARLALLNMGIPLAATRTACELGFGQGMSINIHAATSTTQWWGTDFNPAQAGFAREVAAAAGSGARLFDEAFDEFCRRPDLPEMDFIGLHGIWSWISDENRKVIVDFARRKLKVGGVFYVSYNTQPGWAAAVPLRDLLTGHAEVMGAQGQGLVARIDAAIAFAEKLLQAEPGYAKANPQVAQRLKHIASQDRHYVAHEYFNRDWEPMSFAKMAAWLSPAKLNFAGSAHYFDHVDALNFTPAQHALLKDIPDPMFRQTVRDFCTNQQFRKDYWVKGARSLSPLARMEALREQSVVLVVRASEVKLKGAGPQQDVQLNEAMYRPILDALSDQKPRTIRELYAAVQSKGVSFAQLLQCMIVLTGKAAIHLAQTEEETAAARSSTDKLNRHVMNLARGGNEIAQLASPLTGSGVLVPRFSQLFLLARSEGAKTPQEWARIAWRDLALQNQSLVVDGKQLATPEENLAELTRQATEFANNRLPVLQALQIA